MKTEKTIAIIDYGAGNLKNVETALRDTGINGVITSDPDVIDNADGIILPGVGAFRDAMQRLNQSGLTDVIDRNVRKGKIFQGICLGMQMLFDSSSEDGLTAGLGYIPGTVELMQPEGLKIPHMGWNELVINRDDPFMKGIHPGDYVYFVHSYAAVPENFDENVLAYAEYGMRVPAVVRKDNVIGTQFHPEKSAAAGAVFLNNLKELIS
ncbi:MAG: imidazole glycerol phosphate synthase subunit HisH [Eubacteriaceae bacterium]|jgi:glutamine amidotransferase